QVLAHKLGHLEHVDLGLPAENGLQRVVRLDHPLVLLILQLVLLDVRPELLRDFGPWDRLAADHFRERRTRRHRLHERRIRLASGLLLLGHLLSFNKPGGFAPPDPPTRSLAGTPVIPAPPAWLTRYARSRGIASVRAIARSVAQVRAFSL